MLQFAVRNISSHQLEVPLRRVECGLQPILINYVIIKLKTADSSRPWEKTPGTTVCHRMGKPLFKVSKVQKSDKLKPTSGPSISQECEFQPSDIYSGVHFSKATLGFR